MSDDHQSFDVGGPSKSSVTLGLTASCLSFAPTTIPAGATMTTKPLPTVRAGTSGGGGIGRGLSCEGAQAALAVASARAMPTAGVRGRSRGDITMLVSLVRG